MGLIVWIFTGVDLLLLIASKYLEAAARSGSPTETTAPSISRWYTRDDVAEHGDGFAARQFVGVVAKFPFGEARRAVAYALDEAKPGCGDAHRSEKCGHRRRGDFMGPIREQTCQPNAKHGAIQPIHAASLFLRSGAEKKSEALR
jgi:hypothetical protein